MLDFVIQGILFFSIVENNNFIKIVRYKRIVLKNPMKYMNFLVGTTTSTLLIDSLKSNSKDG